MRTVSPCLSGLRLPHCGRRRFVAAWAGLAILLLNVLAAAVLPPPAAQDSAFAQSLSGRIVICTAGGLEVVNPDGKPVSDTPPHHSGICVFCLPLLHGGFDAPAVVAALPQPVEAVGATLTALPVSLARLARLAGSAAPRAPPAV